MSGSPTRGFTFDFPLLPVCTRSNAASPLRSLNPNPVVPATLGEPTGVYAGWAGG